METSITIFIKSIKDGIVRLKFNLPIYLTLYLVIKITNPDKHYKIFKFILPTEEFLTNKVLSISIIIFMMTTILYPSFSEEYIIKLLRKILFNRFSEKQIMTSLVVTICRIEIPLIVINSIHDALFAPLWLTVISIILYVFLFPIMYSLLSNDAESKGFLLK